MAKKLGNNPLFAVEEEEPVFTPEEEEEILEASAAPEVFTTMSFKIRKKHLKTLRDYAYTNRLEIKEALDVALETFFASIDTAALMEYPERPKKTRRRGV